MQDSEGLTCAKRIRRFGKLAVERLGTNISVINRVRILTLDQELVLVGESVGEGIGHISLDRSARHVLCVLKTAVGATTTLAGTRRKPVVHGVGEISELGYAGHQHRSPWSCTSPFQTLSASSQIQ